MEIVSEQYGAASTFIDDANRLLWFVRQYNNTLPEYIRVARMYFFGTPIRRTGAGFRRATPGCVAPSSREMVSLDNTPESVLRPQPLNASLRDTQVHPAKAALSRAGG